MVFEWLAHHLEYVARKFRQLVEKQQSVMRERNFAWPWNDSTADEAGIGDGVMRGSEWPLRHQPCCGIENSGDGMNLGCLESFFKSERSENRRQALGEHGLAGAGRPDHENVVAAGRSYFQGTLRGFLTTHIFKVDGEMLQLSEQVFSADTKRLALNDADHRRVEQFKNIKQGTDRVDIDALDHGRFGGIGGRQNKVGNIFFACQDRDRQHAGHGANAAVEAEFTNQEEAF